MIKLFQKNAAYMLTSCAGVTFAKRHKPVPKKAALIKELGVFQRKADGTMSVKCSVKGESKYSLLSYAKFRELRNTGGLDIYAPKRKLSRECERLRPLISRSYRISYQPGLKKEDDFLCLTHKETLEKSYFTSGILPQRFFLK